MSGKIKMFLMLMLLSGTFVAKAQNEILDNDFSSCGSNIHVNPQKDCPSAKLIVSKIDSIYLSQDDYGRDDDIVRPDIEIQIYVESLPSCINKDCIQKYYLNQFKRFCNLQNMDSIVYFGEIYIYLGAEEEIENVISVVSKIHAIREKKENVSYFIDILDQVSSENDNMFDEDVEKLKKEINEIQQFKIFEKEMQGKWVLLESIEGWEDYSSGTPTILFIEDISKSRGAWLYRKKEFRSQAIESYGPDRSAIIQFSSFTILDNRDKTDLAHSYLDYSRRTRSETKATLSSSNASVGTKLALTTASSIATTMIDHMSTNMNTSYRFDEVYCMGVSLRNENILDANVTYLYVTTSSSRNVTYDKNIKDKKMQLVRWEKGDSVYFVSNGGSLVTLENEYYKDPMFDDYWKIKKKHSIWNPRYFLPLLGVTGLGVAMIVRGVNQIDKSTYRDAFGNYILNPDGTKMCDDKLFTKGLINLGLGMLIPVITDVIIITLPRRNRDSEFEKLNQRNHEKLRKKARTSMSLSPSYSMDYNIIGAEMNINF